MIIIFQFCLNLFVHIDRFCAYLAIFSIFRFLSCFCHQIQTRPSTIVTIHCTIMGGWNLLKFMKNWTFHAFSNTSERKYIKIMLQNVGIYRIKKTIWEFREKTHSDLKVSFLYFLFISSTGFEVRLNFLEIKHVGNGDIHCLYPVVTLHIACHLFGYMGTSTYLDGTLPCSCFCISIIGSVFLRCYLKTVFYLY